MSDNDLSYKGKDGDTEYQFWNAPKSGETYAVEVDAGGNVVGICGPLHYDEVKAEMLPLYSYTAAREGKDWGEWTYDERTVGMSEQRFKRFTKALLTRVTPETHQRIKVLAAKERRTIGTVIRAALAAYIEEANDGE